MFLYTFCCDIDRFNKNELSNVLKILLKSLHKNISEYKLICFSNFIDQLKTDINHKYNIEFREYYDNNETKMYSCKWQNLSFNKINVYKDLYDEFQTNFCWIDLDTIICGDISYINDLSNVFIENGGNCTRDNVLFSNNTSIVIPRNRYIQGNFWKLSIELYEELMKTLKELNDKNLKLRYDLQDLFGYYIYIKNNSDKCNVNVIGKNIKQEVLNGLCIWEESGDCHPSVEGLQNLYITEFGELKSRFYPEKIIHILSFTFFKILELQYNENFKLLFEEPLDCCLVTICIGEKYLDQYNSLFKESQEKYAKKCGYDFKVITDYISEPKHPDLISFNKILVSEYNWEKEYDFIIFVDADIIINENTPPLHSQYNFRDNIGVVNQSQPTLQARHLCQKHKGYEVTAKEYYKLKCDLDIETDHIINTGVLVIQPKIHMKFLRDIFDKYSQKQIGHPCKFHYEQSVIGYEIQKANKYYFMDMKWNAIWANNKYYFNTIKKQDLTLLQFYYQNYFIHLAGNCDFDLIPRLYNLELKDEKNCEYISIRGIAKNCDHFPKNIISDTNNFDPNDYKCINENDTVFVITSVLDKFIKFIIPTLGNTRFKLVTGACVKGVPHEISKLHQIDYIKILQKNVTRWYTQNFDGTIECVPIPLGIDYHTLQRGNHPWGPMASAKDQETILKEAANFNFEHKRNRTFSSFHFQLFERHNRDRHRAIDHLKNVKFNDVIKKPVPRKSLWNCMRSYKFIISPHGNGLDCHRTYESMLLGSVAIVRSSTLDGLYEGMPILIVDDWKDLTEEVLENYTYTGDLEKLKLSYWISLIKNNEC